MKAENGKKQKPMEKKKHIKRQNLIQLLISLVVLVLIQFIGSHLFMRFDLTAEKRYTLTDMTKNKLKKLNDYVYVKIYLEGEDLPIGFRRLQKSIKETLDEFAVYAGENIEYEFINPFADIDMAAKRKIYEELTKKGLKPVDLKHRSKEGSETQKMLFPGAIISYKGYEVAVNLLKNNQNMNAANNLNNSIQSLEYEFINAIHKLQTDKRPQIAFIEGHGELSEYEVMDITTTLSEYYSVDRGQISGQKGILQPYKAIIVAKPVKPFSEMDKFVIDQYIMQGGKVLWLIEGATASLDSLYNPEQAMIAMASTINLDDMLFKYGVRINHDLLQDMQCAAIGLTTKDPSGKPAIRFFPWLYSPLIVSHNNHTITKYMNLIKTEFISSLDTVGSSENLNKTILLTTSRFTKQEQTPARVSLDIIRDKPEKKDFKQSYKPIAALVEGKFPSVFKNRIIPGIVSRQDSILTQSKPTKMIFVSDGDIIRNEISERGDIYPLGFDRNSKRTYTGNSEFILNAVNYLCDDEGLMSIRLREIKLRLLDKTKIERERLFWQIINVVIPVVSVILFGIIINVIRRKRYT